MVAKEQFHAAFVAGDVATVAAYFTSDAGRAEVDATERYLAVAHYVNVFPEEPSAYRPWYFPTNPGSGHRTSLLREAIRRSHHELLEWVFGGERVDLMPATLVRLLLRACLSAIARRDVRMLERAAP